MSQNRPNIFLIITDQQRFDTINALGFPHMDTPHLDRLVNEGTTFTNCHVTAPSCAPSRASLFTGHYPHSNGILKNADRWTRSWVENLTDSGYHTVNTGKMHTFPFTTPCGFKERYVVENKDRYLEGRYFFDEWDKALAARGLIKQQRELYREKPNYSESLGSFTWDIPADMHSDHFTGGLAKWWLNTYPKTAPLFMEIGFPGPHPPYDPTPEALEPYLSKDIPLDEVSDNDLQGQPQAYQGMRVHNCEVDHDSVVHQLEPTEAQRLSQRRHYCANMTMIDQEVGEIMAAAKANGYLDEDTVIIFTSDHGDCLTDHGHSQKWTMYEQVTNVPLIVWSSNKRFEGGRKIDDLISLFDVGPTILELAGCEIPAHFTAESLVPALDGDSSWQGRDMVFAEHPRDGNFTTADYQVMVRTDEYKLVEIYGSDDAQSGREGMLFDLKSDPKEQQNLYSDVTKQGTVRDLRDALLNWRIETGRSASKLFDCAR